MAGSAKNLKAIGGRMVNLREKSTAQHWVIS